MKKNLRRITVILKSSLNSIMPVALNIVFSLLVVKLFGSALWGTFVWYFLIASLSSVILNWGNKEILLRQFAAAPSDVSKLWTKSLISRLFLLLPVAAVLFIVFPSDKALVISIWTLLLFVIQSFEALVLYYRKFTFSVIAEVISNIILFVMVVLLRNEINTALLFKVYFSALLLKALLYLLIFAKTIFNKFYFSFDSNFLINAFPFFLLSLAGLLSSRVDQYCVSYFLPPSVLGEYQVLKSFLLYSHVSLGFAVLPFVKNIYRLPGDNINKLALKSFYFGLIIFIPYIGIIYLIAKLLYSFNFNYLVYVYSALFVLPPFYYTVIIYKLFKNKKENAVLAVNIFIILISVILSFILIPSLQIEGALLAGVIAQWLNAFIYYMLNNNLILRFK